MDELIKKFIPQIEEAQIIAGLAPLKPLSQDIKNIIITGMGGSGIAGKFTQVVMDLHGTLPVVTNNCYDIPVWVDKHTLALVSSYSGNTEETLQAYDHLKEKGASVIVITSGGKLLEKARKDNFDVVQLPGEWPAPRACFGYSFVVQLFVLYRMELLKLELTKEFGALMDFLIGESKDIPSLAEEISRRLTGKIPVLYSGTILEPVLVRFRQQLNENAKTLAFHAILPEMNHNELVGWHGHYKDLAVVILRSSLYSPRVDKRIDLSKEIIIKHVDTMIEIEAKGYRLLQQYFYLVHLVDWISYFLAKAKGVDAMAIENINYLKSKLAEYE